MLARCPWAEWRFKSQRGPAHLEKTSSRLILPRNLQSCRAVSESSLHVFLELCWTQQGWTCAELDPETSHFRIHLHSRAETTVSKLFVMKSSQCISLQIISAKAPSFAEIPPNFRETEWSLIHQKAHGLETAVTAKFLVQSLLCIASLKNSVVRSLSGWLCATEYPAINWFSKLVSRDLQIPPWPMRLLTFLLCISLGRIPTQQLPAATDCPPILWWTVPDWLWWFSELLNSLRECKSWVSSSSGISSPF